MRILLACEHAGYELREHLAVYLASKGHEIERAGARTSEPVDYPPISAAAAREVVAGNYDIGISICGTGIGMSIAAGKIPGAIVALCTNEYMARMARAHNNANILCLGSRVTGVDLAESIVDAFLTTQFEGGRHERRFNKIKEIEAEHLKASASLSPEEAI